MYNIWCIDGNTPWHQRTSLKLEYFLVLHGHQSVCTQCLPQCSEDGLYNCSMTYSIKVLLILSQVLSTDVFVTSLYSGDESSCKISREPWIFTISFLHYCHHPHGTITVIIIPVCTSTVILQYFTWFLPHLGSLKMFMLGLQQLRPD